MIKPKYPLEQNSKINFRLILITDKQITGKSNLLLKVKQACKAGVKAVQLREKEIPDSELLKNARSLKKITSEYNTKLLINDRLDIALLSKADGLHSPEKGILPVQSKKFNKHFITGKSVHSIKDAKVAEKDGFDYIIFGPVFRTPAKAKYGKPQGLNKLRNICDSVNIPVFAVGGITPQRTKKCIDARAFGVAVIRAIMKSTNVNRTVNNFRKVLGEL